MHTNIGVALEPSFVSIPINTMLKLSKTSSPQKRFDYDCITL